MERKIEIYDFLIYFGYFTVCVLAEKSNFCNTCHLLYGVDINFHISHVSITPVVLETHDQRVWFQTTQTDSLRNRDGTLNIGQHTKKRNEKHIVKR